MRRRDTIIARASGWPLENGYNIINDAAPRSSPGLGNVLSGEILGYLDLRKAKRTLQAGYLINQCIGALCQGTGYPTSRKARTRGAGLGGPDQLVQIVASYSSPEPARFTRQLVLSRASSETWVPFQALGADGHSCSFNTLKKAR